MRALLLVLSLVLLALPAAAQEAQPFFEVDVLNEGLGQPPADLDRETPRAAVEDLFAYAEEGRWDAAAFLLDLGEIEPADQAAQGPILAEHLFTIIDRKVIVGWSSLLDRPDAIDETATSRSALAGQPRRSLLLGTLDLDGRRVSVRLDRMKPAGGDPVWVFSRQTVENVPRLFQLYGPSPFERALPTALKHDAFWGLAWWEVIGLPLVLLLAAGAGVGIYRVLLLGERTADGTFFEIVLRSLKWPATIAMVTAVISFAGRSLFVFSAPLDALLEPAVAIGFTIAIIMFVMTVLDGILDQMVIFDAEDISDPSKDGSRSRATALSAIRRIVLVILAFLGAGWVLASAGVFRTFGFTLLASAGAITVIVGFAARKVLGNIISSLQIALNRSARIGDQIEWEGEWCTVERIHFTYVQLKVWTGNRIVVPVSEFVHKGFTSYTLIDPAMIRTIPLRLAPGADIDALRAKFLDLVAGEDGIEDKDGAEVLITEQDALGVTFRAQFPAPTPSEGWKIECRIREGLVKEAARLSRETGVPQFPEAAAMDAAA